jgi:PAS domain S-box-containing protein
MENQDKKRHRSGGSRAKSSHQSSRAIDQAQQQGESDLDHGALDFRDRQDMLETLPTEPEEATETIDLASMFTTHVSATGSFDIGSEIWTTTFGKLLQALPIPSFLIGTNCRLLQANQACKKISPDYQKMLGSLFSQLFPGSGVSHKIQSLLEDVFATRRTTVAKAVLQIGEARIWARMTFRSVRVMRERFVLALIEDLTSEKKEIYIKEKLTLELERRVKERTEEIRTSEATYRNILETIADGYYQVDLAGNLTLINDSLCNMIGYTRQELLKMRYPQLVDEVSAKRIAKACREVYKTGKSNRALDVEVLRKDGTTSQVSASIALIRGSDGKPTGLRGVFRDMTEHKRLEEQLQQAAKMEAVGRLAGGVAHDFNNLLTAVLGYSSMLLQEVPQNDSRHEKLVHISDAAERAAGLTKQLLAFSSKQVLDVELLSIDRIIMELDDKLNSLVGEDIELTTVQSSSLGLVSADPVQIEQILTNLVVNARDAMPNGGKITIETANVVLDEDYAKAHPDVEAGSYVMFAVSDTGQGIESETMTLIFDPFFTTKEKGLGTGLGLATVYGIVKQHRGHVGVYSEVARGTTFRVYFPRVEDQSETMHEISSIETKSESKETILVVEDEEIVRNLAVEVLETLGYSTLSARDPDHAQAISQSYEGPIHLLLTDVVLPQMDGRSLYRRLSASRPEMKVLYVSGYTENFIMHHGVLDQGVQFLAKPFTVDVLAKRIRHILAKASLMAICLTVSLAPALLSYGYGVFAYAASGNCLA